MNPFNEKYCHSINLKSSLQLGVALLISSCSGSSDNKISNKTQATAPNILLITVDDLGWSDLSCYGSDLHETPNIDQLAEDGVRFTNAYSASPVSSPTRGSIMTGKYPARLHLTTFLEAAKQKQTWASLFPPITEDNLALSEVTIAEKLKEQNYHTIHIGKWHLGDYLHFPEAQGFDINIGGGHWGCPWSFFFPYKIGKKDKDEIRYIPGLEKSSDGNYFEHDSNEYLPDRLTDEAIICMEQATKTSLPFFINMCYYTVHTPIEAKKEHIQYFKSKIQKGMNHRNADYAAMIYAMDENIGRLINTTKKLGIEHNTIVIFISDNGGFIGKDNNKIVTDNEPLRSGKGSLYEGGIRVPWIVKYPGTTPKGVVCNEAISTIDIYPTLLSMLNINSDKNCDGIDISELFRQPENKLKRENLFFHYPHYYKTTSPVSSIRQGDWKLLKFYEDNHFELYNLQEDIGETNNLCDRYPNKVNELDSILNSWLKNVNAQLPTVNPDVNKIYEFEFK